MELISREGAIEILKRHIKNDKLIKHCLAVAAIMEEIAKVKGKDQEVWYLTGLLHDVDYEECNGNMNRHGLIAEKILKGVLPQECISAIKSHNKSTGYKDDSDLATALKASDSLSGLIIATALVMPDKKLSSIKLKSVKKKFKQKDFARGVDRENILLCENLDFSLDDFIGMGLKALNNISDELGL